MKLSEKTIYELHEAVRNLQVDEFNFSEFVDRLAEIHVASCHADYFREEITLYLAQGGSRVVSAINETFPKPTEFSAKELEAAICLRCQGQLTYPKFVTATIAAGCIGYFLDVSAKVVLYLGFRGAYYVENFRTAAP